MPEFDVPIVRAETADAWNKYVDGEIGLGSKIPRPAIQPRFVQMVASDKHAAAMLAERQYRGWIAILRQITRRRHA